ncbi:Rad4-like protein [Encephalitozoon intestinalis ATCC 50506]|uniref:Rad4-like protein n=1 Tax=Encephalitozoon intestinalis (strain ATCC 50506) TaxID=876142 RepID=E0S5Z0_ENCIT|nr:Rad4-like protein [Encephalitozoon intestinalis ATCC 50506]ADM11125.1 Rad4-like protein [Encephalitozoon intestinalis ATCC 50506]UTX44779.1 BRCT domain-containing protein [Encephalitozoon intestinalis]
MDFEIQSTFKPNVFVCTTGISRDEQDLIRSQLPKHVILEDTLSTTTDYLVSYKAMMTEKYIQALKWNIKILHVRWLYDTDENTKKYEMTPLSGSSFTISGVTDDSLINYHCLLGASFTENLTAWTDFLITNSQCNEKTEFCKKYGIPVVTSHSVFGNDYGAYKKEPHFKAIDSAGEPLFNGKVFFLDSKLPKILFNRLRRLIISNGGTRVSVVDRDVDFIVAESHGEFKRHDGKVFHYQYVFDCVETDSILLPGPYKVYFGRSNAILSEAVCCIDASLRELKVEVFNKLRALGAIVKEEVDASCTHLIIRDRKEYTGNRHTPYKVVLLSWVDQCLHRMRYVNEDKYRIGIEPSNLFIENKKDEMSRKTGIFASRFMLFQFTGLSPILKSKAIERFEKLRVRYSDGDRYEKCTHLIMGSVCTSEKFLSCLCNGGWILRPDFIDNFDNSANFDFGKYEWTADENTPEKERKIVASIKKWRERVASKGKPAFHRWIVRLYCDEQKRESYARVIVNGGGTITEGNEYTHCFVSKNYKGEVSAEKKYSTDYIFSHLFR